MKIKKFKFIDKGMTGLMVEGVDAKVKDGGTVMMDLAVKYRVPVPQDIVTQVQALRFHFLMITGFMPEKAIGFFDEGDGKMLDYDKNFPKDMYSHVYDMLEKVFVTGVLWDDDKFLITATMKGYDELTFAVNTPLYRTDRVTTDWEDSMIELVGKSFGMVKGFIDDVKFRTMQPKQYLLDLFENKEQERTRVTALTDEQAEQEMKEKLTAKGYVMFRPEDVMEDIRQTEQAIIEPGEAKPTPDGFIAKAEDIQKEVMEGMADKIIAIPVIEDGIAGRIIDGSKKFREWPHEIPETAEHLPMKPKSDGRGIRKASIAMGE